MAGRAPVPQRGVTYPDRSERSSSMPAYNPLDVQALMEAASDVDDPMSAS